MSNLPSWAEMAEELAYLFAEYGPEAWAVAKEAFIRELATRDEMVIEACAIEARNCKSPDEVEDYIPALKGKLR